MIWKTILLMLKKIRQDTSTKMMESVYLALESVSEINDNRSLYY